MGFPYGRRVTPARGTPMPGENSDRASTEHPEKEELVTFFLTDGVDRSLPPQQIAEFALRDAYNFLYSRDGRLPRTRPGVAQLSTGAAAPGRITAGITHVASPTVSYDVFAAINAAGDDQDLYYLNASEVATLIFADLGAGASIRPNLISYGDVVLCSVAGQPLREWQPANLGSPAGVKATGTLTTTATAPTDGDFFTLGTQVFFWRTVRVQPGEVTIGANANASAANVVAAVNWDSWACSAARVDAVVTFTSRRAGTIGNAVILTIGQATAGAFSVSAGGTLAGGAAGLAVDAIESDSHPHPAVVRHGPYQRLMVSGDPAEPNRVSFCTAKNQWQWQIGTISDAQFYDTGHQAGSKVAAIEMFMDSIMVHRTGQQKSVKRIRIPDPDPANWTVEDRGFVGSSAALCPEVAVSLSDKHFYLDRRGFNALTGTDTFDEIRASSVGQKIWDYLDWTDAASAFFVFDPDELLLYVFPRRGASFAIFHYGSGRWTRGQFAAGSYSCGWYDSVNERVMLGTDAGTVCVLDPSVCTDLGVSFSSYVVTRALGGQNFDNLIVKRMLLDYEHLLEGSGHLDLIVNGDESNPQRLADFTIGTAELLLVDATMELAAATFPLAAVSLARALSDEHGEGEQVSIRVLLDSGAVQLNSVAAVVAHWGERSI